MSYRTKQREKIDTLIKSLGDRHFTADDIDSMLRSGEGSVGKATIYRYLELMVSEGSLKKFMTDDGKSACYQFLSGESCGEHFHLKCTECGKVIHLECEHMDALIKHLYNEHGFSVDPTRTILCGKCAQCSHARSGASGGSE